MDAQSLPEPWNVVNCCKKGRHSTEEFKKQSLKKMMWWGFFNAHLTIIQVVFCVAFRHRFCYNHRQGDKKINRLVLQTIKNYMQYKQIKRSISYLITWNDPIQTHIVGPSSTNFIGWWIVRTTRHMATIIWVRCKHLLACFHSVVMIIRSKLKFDPYVNCIISLYHLTINHKCVLLFFFFWAT